MYLRLISLLLGLCFISTSYSIDLDWRSVNFEFTNYSRINVDGGAAIYALPSKDTLKFKISFVFPDSIFTLPESNIVSANALTDLLILGGFGGKSYEQIQKELTQNGIALETSLNEMGNFVISCEALSEDFQRVLTLMRDLILSPNFNSQALKLWKQQVKNQFINFSNANTLNKQMAFINVESARLAFGTQHYLSTKLKRIAPEATQNVKMNQIKTIHQQILNRNGLNVLLTGFYHPSEQSHLVNLIKKIPSKKTAILKWLPERLQPISSHDLLLNNNKKGSIKSAIIKKQDMTQSQISLRFYYTNLADLNPIEKVHALILTEIFSSTGGVVGNDRFSKAMRADSGLSYSPHAYFNSDVILPNTNVSVFMMNFQSPNEKVFDAVMLAKKTWNHFVEKGVLSHELDNTRSSMMNRILANELTVFDKSDLFFSKIVRGKLPPVNPLQERLESLNNQRNLDVINQFLKNKFGSTQLGTLVIMGNPDKDQIDQLKAFSELDFVESKDVNSLL